MPRFFIRNDQVLSGELFLRGSDAHHIARSLRMAVGDTLTVCDMQGREYECRITSFAEDEEVRARILSVREAENEPPCRIRLFQALPKGDKLDTVIQKAVECGACEIIPFESERCVVRMKPEAEERKTERRGRIAAEAAKQSGRSVIPLVRSTVSFSEMLTEAQSDLCLFCYEGDGTRPLGEVLKERKELLCNGGTVSVVIGSEGGFSQSEVEAAKAAGMLPIGLGKRILRTETAPLFVLSCLVYVGELEG
ncbi:MAG: 16S rRNA (uracil(1498)-N(3))-methyltransferase [Ruminococcaceae bacterium]|nr:16S rRNA (uracil(1498)-N(3))-methyltransferase [Oscillospiraceae bacterium]